MENQAFSIRLQQTLTGEENQAGYNQGTLFSPEVDDYEVVTVDPIQLPGVTVSWDANTGLISITIGEIADDATYQSITEGTFYIKATDLTTFSHDFTFSVFSTSTDVPLRRHFPVLNDRADHMTPDFIYSGEGFTHVVEFTTSGTDTYLVAATRGKRWKYHEHIMNRVLAESDATKFYSFHVIAVGPNIIRSSLRLEQDVCNELAARLRLAKDIISQCMELGIPIQTSDISRLRAEVEVLLKGIPLNFEDKSYTPISETVYNNAMNAQPDYTQELKHYIQSLLRSSEDTVDETAEESQKNVCQFIESIPKTGRRDKKAVVQLPCLLPARTYRSIKIDMGKESHDDHYMTRIWNAVIYESRSNDSMQSEMSEEEWIRTLLENPQREDADEAFKSKRFFHRMRYVPYLEEDAIKLAQLGVQKGRKKAQDEQVKTYRDSKKVTFDYTTDTNDIDEFLNREGATLHGRETLPDSVHVSNMLIKNSIGKHPRAATSYYDMFDELCRTKEYLYFDFLSDLATELSIAGKQITDWNEFVVKKVPYYDCYVLTRSSGFGKHIFFSLLFPKRVSDPNNSGLNSDLSLLSTSTVFKTIWSFENYFCTEFVSTNVSKLINLVKANSNFVLAFTQWYRFFEQEIKKDKVDLQKVSQNVMKYTWLSMIIALEDKACTEEMFTLIRYTAMEKFKEAGTKIRNTKMLEKMDSPIRSRLQLWAIKKHLNYMISPKISRKVRDEGKSDNMNNMIWFGIVDPWLGIPLSNPKQLIELFYLGYWKNKEEKAEQNAEFNLVKKILKDENKFLSSDKSYFGLADRPLDEPYKSHEFSISGVIAAVDIMKRRLQSRHGNSWQSQIVDEIVRRWDSITWEELATLKSSSTFVSDDPSSTEDDSGKEVSKRCKVLEKIAQELDFNEEKPWRAIKRWLEELEAQGHLDIDIFKKAQHGGLREIYVLELKHRGSTRMVEEISRALCSYFDMEVMTDPKGKVKLPKRHIDQAQLRFKGRKSCNLNSSNDAQRWNNGNHTNKFALMLCRFLPKIFHGLIIRLLRMWKGRRIKLPDGVINILRNHDLFETNDEILKDLADGFYGRRSIPWIQPGQKYIVVESGFMQGILHYTSSLWHCCVLELRSSLFNKVMSSCGAITLDTNMVSSDDSARLVTFSYYSYSEVRRLYGVAKLDQLCVEYFMPRFGIEMSVKSTYLTKYLFEFNSEFFFDRSLYRPTLKWVIAASNLVEVEALLERQECFYNLLSELLEGGAPLFQVHCAQVAQALLHYKLLGSGVNPLFRMFAVNMIDFLPDPSLGYFLMDSPMTAGIFGLNYNYFNLVNQEDLLRSRTSTLLQNCKMTTTTSGTLVRGAQVRYGNRKKWLRLFSSVEQKFPNWRQFIEDDPSVLYKLAVTKEEILVKLLVKLASPGVTGTLSKGNSIVRMIASSVYLLTFPSITTGQGWITGYDKKLKEALYSLVCLPSDETQDLTDSQMTSLFPKVKEYKDFQLMLQDWAQKMDNLFFLPTTDDRIIRSHITVYPEASYLPFPLEKVCKHIWFDQQIPASSEVVGRLWSTYKLMYPWLKSTVKETLDKNLFDDHIQLRNFIARQVERNRVLHLTGIPVKVVRGQNHIDALVSRNYWTHTRIPTDVIDSTSASFVSVRKFRHTLYMMLNSPFDDFTRDRKITSLLKKTTPYWTGGYPLPSTRQCKLNAILHYKRTGNKEKTLQMLRESQAGVIGQFVQTGYRSGREWKGMATWVGRVGSVAVRLNIKDHHLEAIEVDSLLKLRREEFLLSEFLTEQKFDYQPFPNPTRGSIMLIKLGSNYRLQFSDSGIPLKEAEVIPPEKIELREWEFVVGPKSIKLTCEESYPYKHRLTIASFGPLPDDISFDLVRNDEITTFTDYWIHNEPLPLGKVSFLTKSLMKLPTESPTKYPDTFDSTTREGFQAIFKKLWETKLTAIGAGSFAATPILHDAPEADTLEFMKSWEPDFEEILGDMDDFLERQDRPEEEDFEEEDFLDTEKYFDILDEISPGEVTISTTRLLEGFFNHVAAELSLKELRLLGQGKFSTVSKNFASTLQALTGIVYEECEVEAPDLPEAEHMEI